MNELFFWTGMGFGEIWGKVRSGSEFDILSFGRDLPNCWSLPRCLVQMWESSGEVVLDVGFRCAGTLGWSIR